MNKSFYNKKKVFITGHSGFKGSWLCKLLLECGAEVKGYSIDIPTQPSLFDLLNLKDCIKSTYGDIRDYDNLYKEMKKFSPDIVIHLAAQPIVRESYVDPKYTYETNVMGTINVLECIRNLPCIKSALIVTTDKVYKDKNMIYGYREIDELCGYDPYSNSKSCAELACYSYYNCYFKDNENLSISTARAGNVIGGGDFACDRIIPDMVRSYLNKKDILIRNPYAIRPYQYVLDALNGYLTLIEKQCEDKTIEGCYNFGPNDSSVVNNEVLANTFCKKFDNKIKWYTPGGVTGPHESNILVLDSTKSRNLLKWSSKYSLEDTIKSIIEWTLEYEKNGDINKIVEKQISDFLKRK